MPLMMAVFIGVNILASIHLWLGILAIGLALVAGRVVGDLTYDWVHEGNDVSINWVYEDKDRDAG